MIQTILFDLDGTLVDTEPAAARAITRYFADLGIALLPEDAHAITGVTWERACDLLARKYRLPVGKEEALSSMLSLYREALETDLIVVPGAPEAVKSLASHFSLGLVSGSHRKDILGILKRLDLQQYFKVVLGAEDYARSKPAPDGYQSALMQLTTPANRGIVFEDSEPGIQSALNVGLWVVAVSSTNHHGHDTSRAHGSVPDLQGIDATWIRQFELKMGSP